ncbi:MAG: hypothetical protein AAF725_10100 [Acidobacteriota bacterium]
MSRLVEGPFTAYIRHVGPQDLCADGPEFERFWRALSRSVRRELNRRGLWLSPPRFLGVEVEAWCDEALEELVTECYLFLMRRAPTLRGHLETKPNVEGLVMLNVKNFLHERQRSCDPLGYRIFEIARAAVQLAVSRGDLTLAGGAEEAAPRIENATVLRPRRAAASPKTSATAGRPRADCRLQGRCSEWVDALAPELLVACGRRRGRLAERLARRLADLDPGEFEEIVFKALVDGLKEAARLRWRALWQQEQAGAEAAGRWRAEAGGSGLRGAFPSSPAPERLAFQPREFERRAQFAALSREVSRAVERLPPSTPHLGHLVTLWDFLRSSSADPSAALVPSRRRTAELLGIPRHHMPQLYRRLAEILRELRDGGP